MGFLDPVSDFRFILPTETDANSPLSEDLMSQIRENLEEGYMDNKYTGYRASVVTVDSDSTMTIEKIDNDDYDWATNATAELILTFKTGNALGSNFIIVSNTELLDTPDTAQVTIDTQGGTIDLQTFGIAAGDYLIVSYSITGFAHTHNGLDSAPVGVDQNIGSVSVANTEMIADTPITVYSSRSMIYLDANLRSLYVLGEAVISGTTVYDFKNNCQSLKMWLEFRDTDAFPYYETDGSYTPGLAANINNGGSTTYVSITDFSDLVDDDRDIFYAISKLNISDLNLTLNLKRNYYIRCGMTYQFNFSSLAVTLTTTNTIFGSTTLI